MRKLLAIIALVGATSLSFGQGYVQFVNTFGTRFSTNAIGYDPPGTGFQLAAAVPVGAYYFALFAAPSTQNTISTTTDPTLNGWTYVAIGTNTAQAGRLSGNNSDFSAAVNIPGFAPGTTADFAIAGWSATIGTSWAQASAWWQNGLGYSLGQSDPAYFGINPTVADNVLLGSLGGTYDPIFGGSGTGLMTGWGLSSAWVPEPGSFALAGLGAAALVIFRRRK